MTANTWLVAVGCLAWGASCVTDLSNLDDAGQEHGVARIPAALSGQHGRPAIEWTICPGDFLDECAWVALPLDPAAPAGPRLPIFVSRRLAASGRAHAQLWLLQGGPGGSTNAFKTFVEQQLAPHLPDVDFYLLEQRGVGESARLGCTQQEAASSEAGSAITPLEWPACIEALKAEWGDGLMHFNTTADAEDLATLIRRTREPQKRVFVYGLSYGTLRALRLLQTHPRAVDGIVLDSIVAPGASLMSDYDTQLDPVARDLAGLCDADALCNSKLGGAAWDKLAAVFTRLDDATFCPAFAGRLQLRQQAGLLLGHPLFRAHLFALAYRLARCELEDVEVVQHYLGAFLSTLPLPPGEMRMSPVLSHHVALSELWAEPAPSAQALAERCASQLFCPGVSVSIGGLHAAWPRYARDEYVGQWPDARTPILALNGSLDSATPLAKAELARVELTAPHQTFVAVPWSPHGVLLSSPVKTSGAATCGIQMLRSFLDKPRAQLDTSCLQDLVPVDFSGGDAALVERLFGTTDAWE